MSHSYIRPLGYEEVVSDDSDDVINTEHEQANVEVEHSVELKSPVDSGKAEKFKLPKDKAMKSLSTALAQSLSKIRPCVPEGASHIISKFQYEEWRDHIMTALASQPEKAKYANVKIYGGEQIISILNALDIDDEIRNSPKPFSKTIQKLDEYFNKQTGSLSSQMSFRAMEQLSKESCVVFLSRLLKAVRHCGFVAGSTQAEVIAAVATNANIVDFRKAASKSGVSVLSLREAAENIDAQNQVSAKKLAASKTVSVNEVEKSKPSKRRYSSSSSEDRDELGHREVARVSKECK